MLDVEQDVYIMSKHLPINNESKQRKYELFSGGNQVGIPLNK